MIRIKTEKLLGNWVNIFQTAIFLTLLPRAVLRTQPKGYGGALLQK